MRIRKTIETTQEVDVEVSLDEIMAEIASLEEPSRVQEALRLLSLCVGAVLKVPDAIIAEMTPAQKAVVTDALRVQLSRFGASE
ncbi:hypothetical protein [Acidovorax sp.]|uniref:hypothetical protein n=1 Tax=Acidovorax sp. TaxID=1872122 RepID=UPI00391FBF58